MKSRDDLIASLIARNKEIVIHPAICPTCREAVGKFRNQISAREFDISGMCQECQDKTFGPD